MKTHPRPVTVDGEGIVELFAWETEPGFALHILNYTNPNSMRSMIRRFYPIGPLHVEFRMPGNKKISAARALRAGRNLGFKRASGVVQLYVQSIRDFEVVALT